MFWQTIIRFTVLIALFGLAGTVIGGGLGFAIGFFAPEYYIAVFDLPRHADPSLIGVLVGGSQGLIAGVVLGVIAFAGALFYETRSR